MQNAKPTKKLANGHCTIDGKNINYELWTNGTDQFLCLPEHDKSGFFWKKDADLPISTLIVKALAESEIK